MIKRSLDNQKFIDFIKTAEKLKTVIRHSWTSDILRKESVAEHSWMTSLLALYSLSKTNNSKLNHLKIIKMTIVHDLAEAITGDIPTHDKKGIENAVHKDEKKAIGKITSNLDDNFGNELYDLWKEYEDQKTNESIFVKALDKIEVGIQHNIASYNTWDENDKGYAANYAEKYAQVDPFLIRLNNWFMEWRKEKVSENEK